MNNTLINKESIIEAKAFYHESKEWINFALLISNNTFIRNSLIRRYRYKCPYCGKKIKMSEMLNIHHISYMHECITSDRIKVTYTTQTGETFTHTIPDCRTCKKEHPDAFLSCIALLVPVHRTCNQAIQEEHIRLYGNPGQTIVPNKFTNS